MISDQQEKEDAMNDPLGLRHPDLVCCHFGLKEKNIITFVVLKILNKARQLSPYQII